MQPKVDIRPPVPKDWIKVQKPCGAAENVFFLAIANSSSSEIIQLLKENEVHVNCRNINGSTGLHLATNKGLVNIIEI